jgi:GDP-L-fucose synthase
MIDLHNQKIFVAGHNGMVGSALCRRLETEGCKILTTDRSELDLTNQSQVQSWMQDHKPDLVFMCAARVGGLVDNRDHPAEFIYQNLMIQTNIIHAAYKANVTKLLFLGSSCIYPRDCPQPIKEDYLMTGVLEQTNSAYAMAKLAGIEMCASYRRQYGCDFISAMPCNLYGPHDHFHPEASHVPAALIQRFHNAKINGDDSVTIWGSGKPKREFMHVDDLADGLIFLMKNYSDEFIINIGTGIDISIQDFAKMLAGIVGYNGKIENDLSLPDGTPRKVMDISKINAMGWQSKINLGDGLQTYYQWCKDNIT